MSKNENDGASLLQDLLKDLREFQRLKDSRWEPLEASFQMSNRLGVPTEDWIIPPDENKVRSLLEEDSDYIALKDAIMDKKQKVKALALKEGFDTHHKLDWIKFTDPLIGTEALQDALDCVEAFLKQLQNKKHD